MSSKYKEIGALTLLVAEIWHFINFSCNETAKYNGEFYGCQSRFHIRLVTGSSVVSSRFSAILDPFVSVVSGLETSLTFSNY